MTTHPGYDGMWLPQDQDPRMQGTQTRGELACLLGYLEHYRQTLELKCQDLTPAQLGTRSVPPSNMSLLGMVRHMARVEQSWFRRVIERHLEIPRHFQEEGLDAGFSWPGDVDEALVDDAWALWRAEVEHARVVMSGTTLETLVEVHGDEVEVRDLIVHMIEEYARHCGHADLIRECIDGRAGQ